jgi:DNA-binding MarR family transcriptional regulator
MAQSFDFQRAPGHLIRRAHQLAVAIFMEQAAEDGVTPVQFAILNALMDTPGEDQVTLAGRVAFDPATSGSVIGRLEARGWVRREPDPSDRRRKLLWLTDEGRATALRMAHGVMQVQERLVEPLAPDERETFVHLLHKLIADHEGGRG